LRARTGRRRIILSKSYFQIWLAGLETLMIERGLVTREEIEAGKVLSPPKPGVTPIAPPRSRRRSGAAARPNARPKAPALFNCPATPCG
jgi:nitrile hydratase